MLYLKVFSLAFLVVLAKHGELKLTVQCQATCSAIEMELAAFSSADDAARGREKIYGVESLC